MDQATSTPVKIVDFEPFLDGSDRTKVAKAILESFKSIGFVYLLNHGIPQDKITSMFEWSKRLFSQPMEIKQLAPHPTSGAHHRGYSAPGREKIRQRTNQGEEGTTEDSDIPRDIKESFESGHETNARIPNIWYPEGILPGFKEACLDFYWTCDETKKVILKALALGFDLPEDFFSEYHSESENQLRLLHYPSIPAKMLENEAASRIPSHSDYISITLLIQDQVGGLEVEDPNEPGHFIPVPPIPGSIVVNAGDFLMRWSNDMIKSAVHRVRTPSHVANDKMIPARYSIPYFCSANLSTVVDCIPGTWSEDRPKRYAPTSVCNFIESHRKLEYNWGAHQTYEQAEEYLMSRMVANY